MSPGGRRSVPSLAAVVALVAATALLTGACGDAEGADQPTTTTTIADLGGEGSSSTAAPSSTAGEAATVEVDALDNSFRPQEVEVAAGTEVVWTNTGRNDHNVLPAEGDGWGTEADGFRPGDTYRNRFTEPGTYHYYCSLHGTPTKGMVGTIVVTG